MNQIRNVLYREQQLDDKADTWHQFIFIHIIVPGKTESRGWEWAFGTHSPAGAWFLPWRHCCQAQIPHSWVKEEGLWGQSSAQNTHLEPGAGKRK